jgi:GNAT superfamily N-acetyltransferase
MTHDSRAELSEVLVNGEKLTLRRIRPDDVERLRAAYRRLSPDSQRLRFFSRLPELPLPLAQGLCDVDFLDRAAFVFVNNRDGAIRAVGRYEGEGKGTAEVAVTVEDAFQGQGLGLALMRKLGEHARACGIYHLTAEVLGENSRMLNLLRHAGTDVQVEYHAGIASVTFEPGGVAGA